MSFNVEERALAFLLIDNNNRVTDHGGNLSAYGLEDVQEGEYARDRLDFLEGVSLGEEKALVLSRVAMKSGIYADVHIVANQDGLWIVLLDVSEETRQLEAMQQAANESCLLRQHVDRINLKLDRVRETAAQLSDELKTMSEVQTYWLMGDPPSPILEHLQLHERFFLRHFHKVTLLFLRLDDYPSPRLCENPYQCSEVLGDLFSAFDSMAQARGLATIKSVGDTYLVAAGIPEHRPGDVESLVELAFAIQREVSNSRLLTGSHVNAHLVLHSGSISGWLTGGKKPGYALGGEALDTVAHIGASLHQPAFIHLTEGTRSKLPDHYAFEFEGEWEMLSKEKIRVYRLLGLNPTG